jgi:hypothetical protein
VDSEIIKQAVEQELAIAFQIRRHAETTGCSDYVTSRIACAFERFTSSIPFPSEPIIKVKKSDLKSMLPRDSRNKRFGQWTKKSLKKRLRKR